MSKNKETRFVYYRDPRSGKVLNMTFAEWEVIQNDRNMIKYKGMFEFIRLVDLSSPINSKPEKLDVIDDPLECPICGFIAESEERLLEHKSKIHV